MNQLEVRHHRGTGQEYVNHQNEAAPSSDGEEVQAHRPITEGPKQLSVNIHLLTEVGPQVNLMSKSLPVKELLKRSHETERSRVEQKALISDPK